MAVHSTTIDFHDHGYYGRHNARLHHSTQHVEERIQLGDELGDSYENGEKGHMNESSVLFWAELVRKPGEHLVQPTLGTLIALCEACAYMENEDEHYNTKRL